MRIFFRWLLWLVLSIVVILLLVLGYFWVTEWMPDDVEVCYQAEQPRAVELPDTLTIVSWNVGYAGLGDDMDFFYDGGKTARTSEQRTKENLDAIVAFLQANDTADFILLQEVDFDSKRSYRTDQYEAIRAALPDFEGATACNYVSQYVPIPVGDAIGRVKSGLVTLSKYPMVKALRLQYPSSFAFPMRLFNLKRAMLVSEFLTENGDTLYLNNTHNTAYDTGDMRQQEIRFMNAYLGSKALSVTAGDWNCNPPLYNASKEELENENFAPIAVAQDDFEQGMTFAADITTPSARYGYEPYRKGQTTTTVLDFALLGKKMTLVEVKTIDLDFKNSDHNPVVYKVTIN